MSHQGTTHGRLARIPGTPHQVDARILPDVQAILRQFKVKINAGYAPTGHTANGEHPSGLALDITPDFARGGSWADVNRLAKWAEPKQNQPRKEFRWVGYDGDANHGEGDHLHLSWNHSGDLKRVSTLTGGTATLTRGLPDIRDGDGGSLAGDLGGFAGSVADTWSDATDVPGMIAALPLKVVGMLAESIGEFGARILLYIAFVVGGAALILFGLARAMGVRPANVADVAAVAVTRKPAAAGAPA